MNQQVGKVSCLKQGCETNVIIIISSSSSSSSISSSGSSGSGN